VQRVDIIERNFAPDANFVQVASIAIGGICSGRESGCPARNPRIAIAEHLAVGGAPARVSTRWACDDPDARSAYVGHVQAANPTCVIWTDIVSRSCRAIWLPRHRVVHQKAYEAQSLPGLRLIHLSSFKYGNSPSARIMSDNQTAAPRLRCRCAA
jgi:hypothetical protein